MQTLKQRFTAYFKPHTQPRRSPFTAWRIVGLLLVACMLLALGGSSWFLYSRVYRTLEDANTILLLSNSENVEAINFTSLEQAQLLIRDKEILRLPTRGLRNIFMFLPSSTTTTSAPSTSLQI